MEIKKFIAEGTTCTSCEEIIKRQAKKVVGVDHIDFDYATGLGTVAFDPEKTNLDEILYKIEEKGYDCYIVDKNAKSKSSGWIFAVVGIIILAYFAFRLVDSVSFPEISQNMGLGLLFLVGILTGFHCISMCGGFVVSYTARDAQLGKPTHKSHMMYGLGKIVSYTVIGAAFGLLGSIIAFTPTIRGVAGLLAGLFLVIFGLKMLNIFPILRRIQLRTPGFVSKFVGKKSNGASPLTIGLLNGLMIACGPLQAIYIMAAGTGSVIEGAKLLFVFALGTLPVMIGFGFFASFISGKATARILKASGAIVIVLGLVMINNGLVLTGSGYDVNSVVDAVSGANEISGLAVADGPVLNDGFQEIHMKVTRYGWEPDKFVLKTGVPVRWIIDGEELNGCNNAIQVPSYGLKFDIKPGTQVIEFTPDKEGTIRWSCWMGMIPGTFIVKDDININDQSAVQKELAQVVQAPGGSCGGSSGGCGCGGAR